MTEAIAAKLESRTHAIRGLSFALNRRLETGNVKITTKVCRDIKNNAFEIKKQKSILTTGPRCNFDGKDCCQVLDEDGITMGKKNKNVIINRILLFTICY